MTDKAKIRAEVEKRYRENKADGYSDVCEELWDILSFIDSLQKEPVSEDMEEEIIRYIGYPQEVDEDISTTMIRKAVRHFANWQKTKDESISEDLGNYINELSKQFPEVSFAKLSRIAVRVAKWQKEQMMANTADVVIGLPYENKGGGYTHLVDVSRPLPVGNNKIAIIFKVD